VKRTIHFFHLLSLLVLFGCNAGPRPAAEEKDVPTPPCDPNYTIEKRLISIETEPSGANVWQWGPVSQKSIWLGTTPLLEQSVAVLTSVDGLGLEDMETVIPKLDRVQVKIQKDGFKEYNGNLRTSAEEILVHEITLERE